MIIFSLDGPSTWQLMFTISPLEKQLDNGHCDPHELLLQI